MTKTSRTTLLCCLLALATGCASGPITTLTATRPADITVSLAKAGTSGLCPGFVDHAIIRVVDTDGQPHATTGHGKGLLLWPNFDVQMRGGTMDPTGRLRYIPNAERLLFKPPQLTITPIHWPKRAKTQRLPVRFDCAFKAHFSGAKGRRGKRGKDGLQVLGTVSVLKSKRGPLVRVVLRSTGGDGGFPRGGSFLLEPGKGSLTILVRGGKGGEAHEKTKRAAADGGDAGSVELHIDPAAEAYAGMIKIVSGGGEAGGDGAKAGAPGPPPKILKKKVFEPL